MCALLCEYVYALAYICVWKCKNMHGGSASVRERACMHVL